MKKGIKILLVWCTLAIVVLPVSCVKDLLKQEHPTQLSSGVYWNTVADAENGLHGVYAAIKGCFNRDYLFDGHGEFTRVRQTYADYSSGISFAENLFEGAAYSDGSWTPDSYGNFNYMYTFLYGGIHRANYVIDNVREMLENAKETDIPKLETIMGEARLLRGMCYFKLISMWGDVPYFDETIKNPEEAFNVSRMPIGEVYEHIIEDFTYAAGKLPDRRPISEWGRATRAAALSFRGKTNLYWASWNKNGWPELEGFKPSADGAAKAFKAAADDFIDVIENPAYGLQLYRGGAPGDWGEMGRADVLPNYYYLFTPKANGDNEFIFVFTHGGPSAQYRYQGEQLMRLFAGRGHQNSQSGVMPRYEIADRYQLTTTGDYAPPLVPMAYPRPTDLNHPANNVVFTTPGSARNPESYRDRDYRMKGSILWDFEVNMGFYDRGPASGYAPWIYYISNTLITQGMVDAGTYSPWLTDWHVGLTTNGTPTNQTRSGYAFRKFVRDESDYIYRNEGSYNWPVIRLADVYLMYAEADNELNGPQATAIDLVNRIRARGGLPALTGDKTADSDAFFKAIEQERIIELLAEGQRGFDIRRWRKITEIWGEPNTPGEYGKDTRGENEQRFFHNMSELRYRQNYICRIPQKERDRNPNLTQNTPWL